MNSWLESIMAPLYGQFYYRQVLVIVAIYICGLLLNMSFDDDDRKDCLMTILMAFPTGLALFMFVGVVCLTVGIPYKLVFLIPIILLLIVAKIIMETKKAGLLWKNKSEKEIDTTKWSIASNKKQLYLAGASIIACVIIAIAAVSGKTAMSVSNDSLYYFWQYPRAIVSFGGLRDQFDNFLTDTGLGASVIGSLPFLFGFGETFGIQEFFHINFVIFFGLAVYEEIMALSSKEDNAEGGIETGAKCMKNKKAYVIAIMAACLLATCTPVYILAHWAMSNMYFMEYAFMALMIGKRIALTGERKYLLAFLLLLYACSQLRMEGGIFVLLIVIITSFVDIPERSVAGMLTICMILQIIMDIRIFAVYTIDNPYLFMTAPKAIVLLLAELAVIIYLTFIKNKIPSVIKLRLPILLMAGLLLVNIVLCLMDSVTYIGNLKAFYGNLFGQSGWGMLPYLAIGSLIVIFFWELILNKDYKISTLRFSQLENSGLSYWLCSMLGFFLTSLAVSFARGDMLDVNTGDSGNRVLLQIAPLVLISIIMWFVNLVEKDGRE